MRFYAEHIRAHTLDAFHEVRQIAVHSHGLCFNMCIHNILLSLQVVQDRAGKSRRYGLWRELCAKCAWDRHLNNIHSHDCTEAQIPERGLSGSSPSSRLRSRSSDSAKWPVFVIGEKETDCTHVLSCEVQEKLAICAGSERCILNVARNHSQNVARERVACIRTRCRRE